MQFQVPLSAIKWIRPFSSDENSDLLFMEVGGELASRHTVVILAQFDTEDLEKELKRRKDQEMEDQKKRMELR